MDPILKLLRLSEYLRVIREVQSVSQQVQARLPEIETMRKIVRRKQSDDLPVNPTNINDLHHLPENFKNESCRWMLWIAAESLYLELAKI